MMADPVINPLLPVSKVGSVLRRQKKLPQPDSEYRSENDDSGENDQLTEAPGDHEQTDKKPERHIDTYA